jgi:hypothetical protein
MGNFGEFVPVYRVSEYSESGAIRGGEDGEIARLYAAEGISEEGFYKHSAPNGAGPFATSRSTNIQLLRSWET